MSCANVNSLLWFLVNFDTGSSDFFLPGVNGTTNCEGHKRYDTNTSSSANDLGKTFNLTYADGSSVQGNLFSDQVVLGGVEVTYRWHNTFFAYYNLNSTGRNSNNWFCLEICQWICFRYLSSRWCLGHGFPGIICICHTIYSDAH